MEEEGQKKQGEQVAIAPSQASQTVSKPAEVGTSVLKKFPKSNMKQNLFLVVGSILVVLAGVGSGWMLSGGVFGKTASQAPVEGVAPGAEKSAMEAGVEDKESFPDTAEGILLEGGIDGEGTHRLDRDLGPQKYVYLTSTVIDLESFKDKKVQVWGETIAAQKAPWLMDVGKIKVTE